MGRNRKTQAGGGRRARTSEPARRATGSGSAGSGPDRARPRTGPERVAVVVTDGRGDGAGTVRPMVAVDVLAGRHTHGKDWPAAVPAAFRREPGPQDYPLGAEVVELARRRGRQYRRTRGGDVRYVPGQE